VKSLPRIGAGVWLLGCFVSMVSCGRVAEDGDADQVASGGDAAVPPGVGGAAHGGAGLGVGSGGGIEEIAEVRDGLARLVRQNCTSVACLTSSNFEQQRLTAGIEAGRLTIDLAVLEDCLTQSVGEYIFDSRAVSGYGVEEKCAGLFVPLSPLGAPCDTDFACIDGFCDRDDFSRSRPHYVIGGCGVCAPRGQAGQRCLGRSWIGGDLECAEGLICLCEDGNAGCSEGTCARPLTAALGEPCGGQIACEGELHCGYGASEVTCVVPQATGLPCDSASACISDICLDQDEEGQGLCGPRQPGSVCESSSECESNRYCEDGDCKLAVLGTPCYGACSDDSLCVWDETGTCLLGVGRGEACRGLGQCPADNLCIDGKCGRYLGVDEACESSGEPDVCPQGTSCSNGACRLLPGDGEACSEDCAVGACQDGTCGPLAEGSPCDEGSMFNGADPCGPGLECGGSYADARCELRPAIGDACPDGWCDTGAFCASDERCAAICVLDSGEETVR
jgi:hypothetical protein